MESECDTQPLDESGPISEDLAGLEDGELEDGEIDEEDAPLPTNQTAKVAEALTESTGNRRD